MFAPDFHLFNIRCIMLQYNNFTCPDIVFPLQFCLTAECNVGLCNCQEKQRFESKQFFLAQLIDLLTACHSYRVWSEVQQKIKQFFREFVQNYMAADKHFRPLSYVNLIMEKQKKVMIIKIYNNNIPKPGQVPKCCRGSGYLPNPS